MEIVVHVGVEQRWQRKTLGSSVPWLLKYAFSDRFGVLVGGESALAAASYNVSPRIVLDAGTAWGLNSVAPNTALFSGITVPFN